MLLIDTILIAAAEQVAKSATDNNFFVTVASSFFVSILGMLVTNAVSTGWRSSRITNNLRDVVSSHISGVYTKIDSVNDNLQMRIDGGLRVIDDKMDEHFKDDVINFAATRRDTGEVGHALREKIREVEIWGRDNFLLVRHFDAKISQLSTQLEQQDRVSDARNEENRAAHSDVVRRLDAMERNGKH